MNLFFVSFFPVGWMDAALVSNCAWSIFCKLKQFWSLLHCIRSDDDDDGMRALLHFFLCSSLFIGFSHMPYCIIIVEIPYTNIFLSVVAFQPRRNRKRKFIFVPLVFYWWEGCCSSYFLQEVSVLQEAFYLPLFSSLLSFTKYFFLGSPFRHFCL